MKKILTCLICTSFIAHSAAAFGDIDETAQYAEATERLAGYGIICGDENGNFNPYNNITRAEFAKIAVITANIDYSADAAGLFSDTPEGYWANGYINAAAKEKLILGYPDGSFHPENGITCAEAVTITLRLLGYSTAQLGDNFPDAYMSKGRELGICGLLDPYSLADRQTAAVIIDKALMCEINSDGIKKTKLIENLNYSVTDECIILATQNEYKQLLADEAATSLGTYKYLCENMSEYTGTTAKLVLDENNNIVSVLPIHKEHKRIAVESIAGSEITYRENSAVKTINFKNDALVYYNTAKTTFSDVKNVLEAGAVFDIYYSANGIYDYALLTKYELQGPVVIYDQYGKSVFPEAERIIRDGYEASFDKLEIYDVLYYDSVSKTLYAYCDTASGIYEKALPNKANISSVVVSGKTYELETRAAAAALGEYPGAYNINDYVVALLGRDGRIAAVIPKMQESVNEEYGVVLSCRSDVDGKTKKYYAKCLTATGAVQEFETHKDYSNLRGKVAEYEFKDGMLYLEQVRELFSPLTGSIDAEEKKLGAYPLSSSCKLIDINFAPQLDNDPDAEAKVIELSDIPKNRLEGGDVKYYVLDKNGKIAFAVFDNITKYGNSFGIVTKYEKLSSNSTYTIDINGRESTYNVNFVSSMSRGQPVMADIHGGKLISIVKLHEIKPYSKITSVDSNAVSAGKTNYTLAKDAAFYIQTYDYQYNLIDVNDIDLSKVESMELFSDSNMENGGRIRVVKVILKK